MRASSEAFPRASEREVQDFFRECRELTDARLDVLVPRESVEPGLVHQAIRWSLFAGGKRLRPALVLAAGRAFGAHTAELLGTACALEMIHTYSLIHDDLPAMDDDELRRGRPTCHVRFDEATAILAGDALQTLAFQTIAEDEGLSAQVRVRVMSEVSRAAGTPHGMIAGQAYDLAAESRDVTGTELERIHHHKTGALLRAAVRSGATIARAGEQELEAITQYGARLGLLFQITDDLLDVTATAEDLGKTPGKDARARKATYPSLYGIEASGERARTVHREACAALERLEKPTHLLHSIADFILERRA
jgi:geranylgeranyl pyrophosphate synthase